MSINKLFGLSLVMSKYTHSAILDSEISKSLASKGMSGDILVEVKLFEDEVLSAMMDVSTNPTTEFGRVVSQARAGDGKLLTIIMQLLPYCYNLRHANLSDADNSAIDRMRDNLSRVIEILDSASGLKQ